MKRRRSNTLVALSSAAVMTVYAAGFMRTRAAAERFDHASRERIPVLPAPAPAVVAPPPSVVAEAEPLIASQAPVSTPSVDVRRKTEVERKTDQPETAAAIPAATPEKIEEPTVVKTEPVAPAPVTPSGATATPAPAAPPPMSPSAEVLLGGTELRDGTFLGWGSSRHGDIQASVTILSGRITAVSIAQCRTRYSCDVIAHLPGKVLKDQTPEKLNNVSGATQSVDAFYYAVVDAMSKAK